MSRISLHLTTQMVCFRLNFNRLHAIKKFVLNCFLENFLNLEPIYGFPLISGLNNLRVLQVLANFEDISDESVLMIIKKCNQLEELTLRLNGWVTDESMALIGRHLPDLRKLCAFNSNVWLFRSQFQ